MKIPYMKLGLEITEENPEAMKALIYDYRYGCKLEKDTADYFISKLQNKKSLRRMPSYIKNIGFARHNRKLLHRLSQTNEHFKKAIVQNPNEWLDFMLKIAESPDDISKIRENLGIIHLEGGIDEIIQMTETRSINLEQFTLAISEKSDGCIKWDKVYTDGSISSIQGRLNISPGESSRGCRLFFDKASFIVCTSYTMKKNEKLSEGRTLYTTDLCIDPYKIPDFDTETPTFEFEEEIGEQLNHAQKEYNSDGKLETFPIETPNIIGENPKVLYK